MGDAGKDTKAAMTPDGPTRLEQLKSALTEPADTISAAQKYAGERVREATSATLGQMKDAHRLVSGVLGGILLRTDGKRTPHGGGHHERRVLFASYVVGMPLCEQAILEGRYLQALTLLRHEMETLAQIMSSHAGKRTPGKQATMAILGRDIARYYGDLSAAAHASNHVMASGLLTEEMEGHDRISTATYFYPVENRTLARRAFALHLILTIRLIEQVGIDYGMTHPRDSFRPLDLEAVNLALDLMKAEGMVEDIPAKTSLEV